MNRRDLFVFVMTVVWATMFFIVVPKEASSLEIIKFMGIYLSVLTILLFAIVFLSFIFPKFGKWGDKKLFRKE